MTELKRLEISGIRIFKEDDPQIIDFEPLTLIVGANGTGKSTIIESLKFATIGKLQREMITLPDIWEKDKIESKVSLNFNSFDNNNYEVNLSPSIGKSKNNRLSFQTGNCQLTIQTPYSNQKYVNIKPTDIEKEIPKYFGVSPAIIENVIFCDQRQSCWPIDDKPPVLKQKFDQFFNTDKYNDAIEALNETKKDLNKQINDINLELARQEQRMNSYKEHKDKKIELKRKISSLDHEINENQILYNENKSKLEDYELIKPKIEEIKKKIKNKKIEKESESHLIENLNKKIHDLQSKDSLESSIEYNASDITSNEEKIDFCQKLLNQYNENKTKLESQKKSIKEKVDQLQKNLEEIQSANEFFNHFMKEFVEKFNSDDFESVLANKGQIFDQEQKNFDELKIQRKTGIDQKISEITEYKINFTKEKDELSTIQIQLNENKRELSKIGQINEAQLKEAEENKNNANKKLAEFLESSKNLQEIEEELNKQKINLSNIEEKKEEYQKYEKEVERINEANAKINKAKEMIQYQIEIIQNTLKIESIEPEKAQQIIDDKIKELKNKNNSLKLSNFQLNKNLNEVTVRIESFKSSFDENEKEGKKSFEKIQNVINDVENYSNECESIENKLKNETQKLARLKSSENVYTDFKYKASKIIKNHHHSCPLCGKDFTSKQDLNNFLENIDLFISNLPEEIKNCESEINIYEKRRDELKSINDDVRIYKQSQEKREKFSIQINENQIKEINLKKQINEITEQMENIDKKLEEIRELKENVLLLNQAIQQLKSAKEQKGQIPIFNDELPSIDEIQLQEVQLHEEYTSIMSYINDLYKSGNLYMKDKMNFEKNASKADQVFNETKEKFERKIELDSIIDQLQAKIENQKMKVEKLNDKINELNGQRLDLDILYQKQIDEQEKKRDDAKNEFQNCFSLVKQIKKSKEKLNEVDPNDLSKQLEELKIQHEQKKEELRIVNEKITRQTQFYEKMKKESLSLQEDKENLQYQKEYFQHLSIFESIEIDLKRLKLEKLNELGELRKIDYDELKEETSNIEKALIKLRTQRESYQNQYEEEDISMCVYETSFNIFNENQIQKSIIEKSQNDIERYRKELNRIILDFHTKKMEEINNTIYNLWQNTYYGRDVETISIRCDKEKVENDKNSPKIQYNYKVVMIKNDIEMDMCKCASAGQRMLASIIIRLALAKTFAANCGIIAFDEPTTNVDKMNIKCFAKELINLFKSKDDLFDDSDFENDDDSDQKKNFQIILISHDLNFVQLLNEEGMIDNFYQIESVSDGNQTYSQIIRKKMNENY